MCIRDSYKPLFDKAPIMVIDVPKIDEILYVFMASDILKNISYKLVPESVPDDS